MTVLSIITPCYNEEAGIAQCSEAVRAVMAAELPEYDYEHIFIDNCSQDLTVAIFREIAASDSRVKIIVNSRNFGPALSLFHAMLQSTGDAAIPILADLQTPPALIREWSSFGGKAPRPSSPSSAAATIVRSGDLRATHIIKP